MMKTHIDFFVEFQIHFENVSVPTATYIRVVYIRQVPGLNKYVILKSHYQVNFDHVHCQEALHRFACYFTPQCEPEDATEKVTPQFTSLLLLWYLSSFLSFVLSFFLTYCSF